MSKFNENVKDLFDLVDEFLKEANSYKTALGDFGIKDFAVSYDGNMKTYLKQNKLAERDLYKMDQFLKITLPNFIRNFSDMIRQEKTNGLSKACRFAVC